MARQSHRFTIYDAMENAGVFETNPANPYSRDVEGQPAYSGPVQYPKMLYHPKGETRVTVPGTREYINGEYVFVGQLSEIVFEMVNNVAEEKALRDAGWHDHPARAIAASGGQAPAIASPERAAELRRRMEELEAELRAIEPKVEAKAEAVLQPKVSTAPKGSASGSAPALPSGLGPSGLV